MRHLVKILLTLLIFLLSVPCHAIIKSKLEYTIPIDYSKLPQEELEIKAGTFYREAIKNKHGEEMTSALNLYRMLHMKEPSNILYNIRLGHLYDIIGMDKYAKGCYYAANGCDSSAAEPYFMLGEFYYKRKLYKKALKFYKEAYTHGYTTHYDTLYKLGDIYEKFGDTEAALKYLKLASEQSPNEELDRKIQHVEAANQTNKEYYSDTRIRLIER